MKIVSHTETQGTKLFYSPKFWMDVWSTNWDFWFLGPQFRSLKETGNERRRQDENSKETQRDQTILFTYILDGCMVGQVTVAAGSRSPVSFVERNWG
jgi:hypothetical protein